MSKKDSSQYVAAVTEIDSSHNGLPDVSTTDLPFETEELRKGLAAFLDKKIEVDLGTTQKVCGLDLSSGVCMHFTIMMMSRYTLDKLRKNLVPGFGVI